MGSESLISPTVGAGSDREQSLNEVPILFALGAGSYKKKLSPPKSIESVIDLGKKQDSDPLLL
jgi:hypothetical protein